MPATKPPVSQRVQGFLFRLLMNMPVGLQRLLNRRPVVREGQTLSPEIQLTLTLQRLARRPGVETLPLDRARAELDLQLAQVGGRQVIGAVRDLPVDGAAGPLPARLYVPTSRVGAEPVPTMMFIHGGGMIYGGLASHDAACRHLAEHSGVQLLAIDYRLAPEHPFPAAVHDCAAAYEWMVAHLEDLNADPTRLAVGGDSAGGYLAATTAVYAAEHRLPLHFQLLIYPVTDFTEVSESRRTLGEGFFLTTEFMDLAQSHYFPEGTDLADPLASVLRRTDFPDDLAPALVVTAGFDPLRDEGEAYARLLAEHGVPVEQRRYDDMIHGFLNVVAAGHDAPAHNRDLAARLRAALP